MPEKKAHKHKAINHLTEGLKELRKMKEMSGDKDYKKVKSKHEKKEVKKMESMEHSKKKVPKKM
jgi:hypothetical protein